MMVVTHSNKPQTLFCNRAQLMRWTGWSAKQIDFYVSQGRLKVLPPPWPNGHLRYLVSSVQDIVESL